MIVFFCCKNKNENEIYCEKVNTNTNNTEIMFYEIVGKEIKRIWSLELEYFEDGEINVINDLYYLKEDVVLLRALDEKVYVYDINKKQVISDYMQCRESVWL